MEPFDFSREKSLLRRRPTCFSIGSIQVHFRPCVSESKRVGILAALRSCFPEMNEGVIGCNFALQRRNLYTDDFPSLPVLTKTKKLGFVHSRVSRLRIFSAFVPTFSSTTTVHPHDLLCVTNEWTCLKHDGCTIRSSGRWPLSSTNEY